MRSHTFAGARTAVAFALLVSLGGCASQPAPYAPKTGDASTGYTDTQLTADRYRVTFTGNSSTDRQRVEDYLLMRSAQVTLNAGRNWFMFDTRTTEAKTTYMSTFSGWREARGHGLYWHSWTWAPPYDAVSRPITRFQAYAEIVLLTDVQAKSEPRALNAHDLIAHLQPVIGKPQEEK